MITIVVPDTWQDLQEQLARILRECGIEAHVGYEIQTVRTKIEIDVYAIETIAGRPNTIVCECKRWKSAVPQEVVHGVRTVMQDVGANVGYIISTAGFQKGAYAAADATNVELVTWEEFQGKFEALWLANFFTARVTERMDRLMTFTEPLFIPPWFMELPEDGKDDYRRVDTKHVPLGVLSMRFSKYHRMLNGDDIPALPLREHPPLDGLPDAVLDAGGYRELLEAMIAAGDVALAEYDAVRVRYLAAQPANG